MKRILGTIAFVAVAFSLSGCKGTDDGKTGAAATAGSKAATAAASKAAKGPASAAASLATEVAAKAPKAAAKAVGSMATEIAGAAAAKAAPAAAAATTALDLKGIELIEALAKITSENAADCDKMGDALNAFTDKNAATLKQLKAADKVKTPDQKKALEAAYGTRMKAAVGTMMPAIMKCKSNAKVDGAMKRM